MRGAQAIIFQPGFNMYKIKEEIYDFNFPLKIKDKKITSKSVYSVYKKNKVISEITTLEGLHTENIVDSLQEFQSKRYKLPSVKFSKSMIDYFKHNTVPSKIHTALLWPTQIDKLKNTDTIKIKVGRERPNVENQNLKNIIKTQKGLKLRIDGNRLCTCQQMLEIIDGIPHGQIDYIEDSFINEHEEKIFHKKTRLIIAMDEDIRDFFKNKNWKLFPSHIKHVVIKLSLIGGVSELNYLTKNLDRKGVTYNLSSTFEGELGLKFLYSLSKIKKYKNMTTPGLDTLVFMKKKKGPNKEPL